MLLSLLRNQFLDYFTTELAELFESASVVVRQFVVIQPEQTQQRDVEIANVMHVFHSRHPDVVGSSDRVPSLAAAPRHPDRHRVGVVVASVSGSTSHSVVG